MNKEDTLKQICKMISSGDIPKEVYDKYLSKTSLGFMNYKELYDFLNEQNKKYKQLKERLERLDNYLDKNYTMENQYWFDHIRDIVEDR